MELDQASVGRLSHMDAMQAQQLAQVEGALRRIEAAEYGYCFVCCDEINTRRFVLDPTNTRCMKCAGE